MENQAPRDMFSDWLNSGDFNVLQGVKRNALIKHTRNMCYQHPYDDERWSDPQETLEGRLCADVMNWGLESAPEDLANTHRYYRHAALRLMIKKHRTLAQRRKETLAYAEEHSIYFAGWDRLCSEAIKYQLGEAYPWYKPIDALQLQRDVRDARDKPRDLELCGYEQIDQASYRMRMCNAIAVAELARADLSVFEMRWFTHALVLFTSVASRWSQPGNAPHELISEEMSMLRRSMLRKLEKTTYLRVPVGLYQLNRHKRVLNSVYMACKNPELLSLDAKGRARTGDDGVLIRSVLASEKPSGRQLAMFVDQKIWKSKQHRSALSVPLQEVPGDPIASVLRTIEQYPIKNVRHIEHLPRVVAGIFAAANRDRLMNLKHGLAGDGVFWDTDTGKRLCKLVGFDPHNSKHLSRVLAVRKLLESFTMHRQFKQLDETGNWVELQVSSPLIEPRAIELNLSTMSIEGLSSRHSWKAWSVEEHLWKSTLDAQNGGAPAFMLLDERAFKLESSAAFNLYWTLINRAYFSWRSPEVSHGHQDPHVYRERVKVLYEWAGMEHAKSRIQRDRQSLHDALVEMKTCGLIEDWACEALDMNVKGLDRHALQQAEIEIRFPEDIVELVARSEHDGQGPKIVGAEHFEDTDLLLD